MAFDENTDQKSKYILTERIIDSYYDMRGIEYLPEKEDPEYSSLRDLYYDMTGSIYSVFGDGSFLTPRQVFYIYLLKYRYITIEQFKILFPHCCKSYLTTLAWRNKNEIRRYACEGKTYYALTGATYAEIRALFPTEYLLAAQISIKSTSASSVRFHDLQIAGIPATILSLKTFSFFDWYKGIEMAHGKPPIECVEDTGKVKSEKGEYKKSSNDDENNIADGVALFVDGHTAIFEVDCNSETIAKFFKKIKKYATYYSSLKNPHKHQLVISVVPKTITSQIKPRRNKKIDTATSITVFQKVKEIMEEQELKILNELLEYITNMCNKRNSQYKTYTAIRDLLKDYSDAGHDLYSGIDDLKRYIDNHETVQYETRMAARRCRLIRDMLYKHMQKDGSESLSVFPQNGISVVVTENFNRYAKFIMPRVSGFMDKVIDEIKKKYPKANIACYDYEKINISATNQSIYLNNFMVVTGEDVEDGTMLVSVSEISCDASERVRMAQFISNFKGIRRNDKYIPIHFLYLVSSVESAVDFVNQTGIDELFYSDFNITQSDSKKVTTRFLDYSTPASAQGKFEYFVVDSEGNKVSAEDI